MEEPSFLLFTIKTRRLEALAHKKRNANSREGIGTGSRDKTFLTSLHNCVVNAHNVRFFFGFGSGVTCSAAATTA